ncbi:MAG: hypothetical protein ATN31_09140 [Candidatus Epulonipiscioides saccharophilum]|nr:MAG: hypothetical protein ATN31_09140 [Epulopiscium sp. AS2M-Bin001]
MDNKKIKEYMIIITYAVLLYLIILNLHVVKDTWQILLTIFAPVTTGFIIAYILKGPYNFFRYKLFKISEKDKHIIQSVKSTMSLVLSYVIVICVVSIITILVVPQLWESIQKLLATVPSQIQVILTSLETYLKGIDNTVIASVDEQVYSQLEDAWMSIVNFVTAILTDMIPAVLNAIAAITSSITNTIFAVIFSIYFLAGKEKLSRQIRKVLYAFLPKAKVDKILYVSNVTNDAFTNFISGQITEAFILGILCFVGMLIFELPYAVLVSVIIGVTNIIPIFGPIFGAIPTTFIVLMDNPSDPMIAVWFIVFILVIQRIDADIIYPRVVGDSIGLPGVFVMLAIVIGSGFLGVAGMIIGVPLAAVIYKLLKESTEKRLATKKITVD